MLPVPSGAILFAFASGHLVSTKTARRTPSIARRTDGSPCTPSFRKTYKRRRTKVPKIGTTARAQPLRLKWTVGTNPPAATAPHLRGDPHLRTPAKAIRDGDGRKGRRRHFPRIYNSNMDGNGPSQGTRASRKAALSLIPRDIHRDSCYYGQMRRSWAYV